MRDFHQVIPIGMALLLILSLLPSIAIAGQVQHPNLLFNREELAALKRKIETQPWAKTLWEKELGPNKYTPDIVVHAFQFALYDDAQAGQSVKRDLLYRVANAGRTWYGGTLEWADAFAYDMTYDLYSAEERTKIEQAFLDSCRGMQRGLNNIGNANLAYICYWEAGVIACAIGNDEILDWSLNAPGRGPGFGGLKPCLDDFLFDGQWWKEATIYGLANDLPGMLLEARAVRHYNGTDLWAYRGKTGGSLKSMVMACIKTAYPLEQTGKNGGSIRLATYGDGSTREPVLVGGGGDSYIVNPPRGGKDTIDLNALLEFAYAETKDPDYAWFLARRPNRDSTSVQAQTCALPAAGLWYGAEMLPANPRPPKAPSSYFPELGMAFLRSDESENYWSGKGLACLILGSAGYGHDHRDKLHIDLYGKGRLFYNDYMTMQYEPIYINWSGRGPGHNIVLVDHQSPANDNQPTIRHDFTPEVKFYAVTARACFDGVAETRSLLLTADYLADFFHLESDEQHTYDYFLHSYGRPYPTEPAAYHPSVEMQPYYWWVANERSRTTDRTWSLDFVQRTAGVTPGIGWGDEWFNTKVGLRVTMTGAPGTTVSYGDGPLANCPPYGMMDGNPEPSMPVLIARRQGKNATFCVVHEPYEMPLPGVNRVTEIARTEQAAGLRVEGKAFSDRAMVALTPEAEGAPPQVISDGAEFFAFHSYSYLRLAGKTIVARGELTAFRMKAPAGTEVTLNEKRIAVKRDGDYLVYGQVKPTGMAATAEAAPAPQVNLSFFPVELRLAQGGQGTTTLTIRGANAEPASGTLVIEHPASLTVTPDHIVYGPLAEGEEKAVPLTISAGADAPERLNTVRILPNLSQGAQFCVEELPVSVGVVITEDNRLPRNGDFVIRSPRYEMRVSKSYGNSYYLLDRDGLRRHGPLYGLSTANGIPSIHDLAVNTSASTNIYIADILRWGQDCGAFWPGKKNLLAIPNWPGVRYNYRFTPEYIVFELPQASGKEYAFSLGLFTSPRPGDVTAQSGGNSDGKGTEKYQWICVNQPPWQDRLLVMAPAQSGLEVSGLSSAILAFNFRNMHQGSRFVLGFVRPEELNDAIAQWGKEF